MEHRKKVGIAMLILGIPGLYLVVTDTSPDLPTTLPLWAYYSMLVLAKVWFIATLGGILLMVAKIKNLIVPWVAVTLFVIVFGVAWMDVAGLPGHTESNMTFIRFILKFVFFFGWSGTNMWDIWFFWNHHDRVRVIEKKV